MFPFVHYSGWQAASSDRRGAGEQNWSFWKGSPGKTMTFKTDGWAKTHKKWEILNLLCFLLLLHWTLLIKRQQPQSQARKSPWIFNKSKNMTKFSQTTIRDRLGCAHTRTPCTLPPLSLHYLASVRAGWKVCLSMIRTCTSAWLHRHCAKHGHNKFGPSVSSPLITLSWSNVKFSDCPAGPGGPGGPWNMRKHKQSHN